jgi:hypothetical protein
MIKKSWEAIIMAKRKRNIIADLIEEYDIETAEDI